MAWGGVIELWHPSGVYSYGIHPSGVYSYGIDPSGVYSYGMGPGYIGMASVGVI